MKTCKKEGCNRPVFSGGYCSYDQYMRRMKDGDLYRATSEPRSPKKAYRIPKESDKRKEQGKTYKQVKDEIRAELQAQGKYNCFFCTKPMNTEKGFHHLKGREGQNFIDKRYLVPAHNQCHVWDYHASDVATLLTLEWYSGFLNRLKGIDSSLYREELKKQDKAGLLFEA